MSNVNLGEGLVHGVTQEEMEADWIAFVYSVSLNGWREKNKKAEIICFGNDGRHLYVKREKWLLVPYCKFRNGRILRLKKQEIIFKHGAHLDSSWGVKSPVRIFLYRRYGNKRYEVFSTVNCKEITIPIKHHCYIAVLNGWIVSSLLLRFNGEVSSVQ